MSVRMRSFPLFACALVALLVVGCASSSFIAVDSRWEQGDYPAAYAALTENHSALYRERDEVLYRLDAGMLAHFAGRYQESIFHLERAEKLIEEHFTTSVTAELGTFLANDTVRPYRGEDYEDVYLNVFLALNHYRLGDMERMMVELRRADLKLSSLERKYQEPLDRARAQAGRMPSGISARFSNSALVRYLSYLGNRQMGRIDDMRIDGEALQGAFETQQSIYQFPVPTSVQNLANPPRFNRVDFVAFSGRSPTKVQEVERWSFGNRHYLKIALPVIEPALQAVRSVRVVLSDGTIVPLELLEDMGAVATETFRLNYELIKAKTIARALAKSVASVATDAAAQNSEGSTADWLELASLLLQVFQEVSEVADLRISRFFPAHAWVGSADLSSGPLKAEVHYLNRMGTVIYRQRIETIVGTVPSWQLVESSCPF